jgi:hypothetical protein
MTTSTYLVKGMTRSGSGGLAAGLASLAVATGAGRVAGRPAVTRNAAYPLETLVASTGG